MSSAYTLLQKILLQFRSSGMYGENVAVVVTLDDESFASNSPQDSALEHFSMASRSRVVVKARSPAIAPLLIASSVTLLFIPMHCLIPLQ